MSRKPYETEIGRAMQQLARAVHYRERKRVEWEHANHQVDKWAAKAVEAGLSLRRVSNYLNASHTSVERAIRRYYARSVER